MAGAKVVDSFRLGDDVVTLLDVPVSEAGGPPDRIRILIEGRECTPEL